MQSSTYITEALEELRKEKESAEKTDNAVKKAKRKEEEALKRLGAITYRQSLRIEQSHDDIDEQLKAYQVIKEAKNAIEPLEKILANEKEKVEKALSNVIRIIPQIICCSPEQVQQKLKNIIPQIRELTLEEIQKKGNGQNLISQMTALIEELRQQRLEQIKNFSVQLDKMRPQVPRDAETYSINTSSSSGVCYTSHLNEEERIILSANRKYEKEIIKLIQQEIQQKKIQAQEQKKKAEEVPKEENPSKKRKREKNESEEKENNHKRSKKTPCSEWGSWIGFGAFFSSNTLNSNSADKKEHKPESLSGATYGELSTELIDQLSDLFNIYKKNYKETTPIETVEKDLSEHFEELQYVPSIGTELLEYPNTSIYNYHGGPRGFMGRIHKSELTPREPILDNSNQLRM